MRTRLFRPWVLTLCGASLLAFILTAVGPAAVAAPTGLVAAYSFDEGSGSVVHDTSGNKNDGTASNTTWSTGKSGSALSFNGTSSMVTVPGTASLSPQTGVTVEAWVRPSAAVSNWQAIAVKEQTTSSLSYGLYAGSDSGPAALVYTDAEKNAKAASAIPSQAWTHIAAVYSGSTLSTFVNGSQVAQSAVSGSLTESNGALRIGGDTIWNEWFAGTIDDLRVYNRALSATEINSDMNTAVTPPSLPDTQPPAAPGGLSATSTTQSSVSLSWNASSDNVAVTGYGVYQNGTSAGSTQATSYTIGGLACGTSYTFAVDAVDAAGNRSAKSTLTASTSACPPSPDTQAPTAPTGLAASSPTETSVALSWKASTDNVGVKGYGVYANGTSKGTSTSTSYTVTGLTCGTSYTFAVDAFDAAGNRSGQTSVSGSTATCSDTTPPTTPRRLKVTGTTASSVSLVWNASSDKVGVAGYDVYNSSTPIGNTSSTSYTASGLACGTSYTFAVDAYDAAGNYSGKAVVGASTAACSDKTPPSAPTNVGVTGSTASSISLSWSASTDNVAVSGYDVYNGTTRDGTTSSTSYTDSGLACGTSYTFSVDAYDAAGNTSGKTSVTGSTAACADTAAPSTPANLKVSGSTASSVSLSWSASTDNVGVAGYDVYDGSTKKGTTASTSYSVSGLACGTSYTFSADAYDAAGNTSGKASVTGSTAACSDTAAPSTPANLQVSGTTSSSISLSWGPSTDNVGVSGYDVFNGSTQVTTTPSTSYTAAGLTCGTNYTFSVDAYDAAGNKSGKASVTGSTGACSQQAPATGSAANVFLSPSGSDSGSGCVRYATATSSYPTASTACASMSKALSLAQPGDVVQLLPGNYGNLTISRQSGADSPKVIVRGDPSLAAQPSCSNGCSTGNVVLTGLTLCGHGLSIRNLDTNGDYQYMYLGATSCPGPNEVASNHDIELVNDHFNAGTLRGHDLLLSASRIGPNEHICDNGQGSNREDNLHIWPDTSASPYTSPYNITLDGNLIYDAVMSTPGCNGAHADLIQTLGYNNLVIKNNVFWRPADSFIQDGLLGGTTIGNGTVVNNFFGGPSAPGGGYTQLGNADPGPNCANGGYLIENNTFASGSLSVYCQDRVSTFVNNYVTESASTWYTCGAGNWNYNVFNTSGITCGSNAKQCTPKWLYSTSNTGDYVHGPDLHLSPSDTCLRNAGNPSTYAATDIDGQQRPQGPGVDVGADETG